MTMADDKPNYPPIRRVVTGHDANNVAKVLHRRTGDQRQIPAARAWSPP